MKSRQIEDGYLLRFDIDEELVRGVTDFCRKQTISAGFLHGLGGVQEVELGFYELGEQEYRFQTFQDVVEILSLNGNIALKDDGPFLHLHGVFGDRDYQTRAGHVRQLVVGGTAEIHLTTFRQPINRQLDSDVGLDLLDL